MAAARTLAHGASWARPNETSREAPHDDQGEGRRAKVEGQVEPAAGEWGCLILVGMEKLDGAYVIRHGWTRDGVMIVAGIVLFIGVFFLPHMEPPGDDHIELFISPIAVWIAAISSSRRKTVRVDKQGITLYRFVRFRRPEFVPWSEVEAVEWSAARPPFGRGSHLEVHRRNPRPAPARPPAAAGVEALDTYLATQVDPDFVETFRNTVRIRRATTFCRLDPARLATVLSRLAPGVRRFGDLGDFGDPGVPGH
ncbi:hypothetical protein SRB17_50540 [Streptomyces sp. RB17]|uniref:hypothetical protein n=1 Tax=Streptomyces sp. RB17 TaxID=2585197 RepID=UPI001296E40D|nr:hypothetical protein [Streptomyces sp. RB17]MQY37051.1 hypothetical protein [Streptomyces sp. RB17]